MSTPEERQQAVDNIAATTSRVAQAVGNRKAAAAFVDHGFTRDSSIEIVKLIVRSRIPGVSISYPE